METQAGGCALFSFDHPIHIPEDAEGVSPFDFFQGICQRRLRSGVRIKKHTIDLKPRSFRQDHGPFDHILQLSNIAGPGISHEAVHDRLRNPLKPFA